MIKNSFIFLDNVSYRKESNLWNNGIRGWNDYLNKKSVQGVSGKTKIIHDLQIKNAKSQLLNENSRHFYNILPLKEHWRLYDYFSDSCVFLDIETSCVNGYITCISLYDGYDTMTFVKGFNLDFNSIKRIISKFKMIVTFNGNVFDIPFLKRKMKDMIPDIPCWDLRHSCSKLGLKGGLKQIEKQLGIKRPNKIVQDLHSGDPIKLWRTFLATGDRYYVEVLVEYNQEDVINLKTIADMIYTKLIEHCRNA